VTVVRRLSMRTTFRFPRPARDSRARRRAPFCGYATGRSADCHEIVRRLLFFFVFFSKRVRTVSRLKSHSLFYADGRFRTTRFHRRRKRFPRGVVGDTSKTGGGRGRGGGEGFADEHARFIIIRKPKRRDDRGVRRGRLIGEIRFSIRPRRPGDWTRTFALSWTCDPLRR